MKDILDTASYYIKKQAGQTTSSGVTLSVTRDTTDDAMFPSTGSKNSASVEYTGGPLLGDVSFTRYGLTSSWFFPLPLDTVFGVRGRIGYMKGNEGKEVPIYERYYLGGINSLRGLREVGPRDPATGDVIGGLTMLNFNVEYVFPLIKNAGMKGVVFFDTGNTWESGLSPRRYAENGRRGHPLVLADRSPPSGMGVCPRPEGRRIPQPLGIHDRDVHVEKGGGSSDFPVHGIGTNKVASGKGNG